MSSPTNTRTLTARIAAISKELGVIAKSGHNSEQNYDFIEYAEVSGKMRDLFAKHGIAIYPHVENIIRCDEVQSKYGKIGYHYIIAMRFLIINADDQADKIERYWTGEATDYGDKGINKAETSGVKYFYMRLFNISEKGDADNDPDRQDNSSKAPKQAKKDTTTDFDAIQEAVNVIDDIESLNDYYKSLEVAKKLPATQNRINSIVKKRKLELEAQAQAVAEGIC